jgi:hypothetical protein
MRIALLFLVACSACTTEEATPGDRGTAAPRLVKITTVDGTEFLGDRVELLVRPPVDDEASPHAVVSIGGVSDDSEQWGATALVDFSSRALDAVVSVPFGNPPSRVPTGPRHDLPAA